MKLGPPGLTPHLEGAHRICKTSRMELERLSHGQPGRLSLLKVPRSSLSLRVTGLANHGPQPCPGGVCLLPRQ